MENGDCPVLAPFMNLATLQTNNPQQQHSRQPANGDVQAPVSCKAFWGSLETTRDTPGVESPGGQKRGDSIQSKGRFGRWRYCDRFTRFASARRLVWSRLSTLRIVSELDIQRRPHLVILHLGAHIGTHCTAKSGSGTSGISPF
jgi:hypothetical protein